MGKFLSEDLFFHPWVQDLPGFQGEEHDSQSNDYFSKANNVIIYIFSGLVINLQINKSINKNDPVSHNLEP